MRYLWIKPKKSITLILTEFSVAETHKITQRKNNSCSWWLSYNLVLWMQYTGATDFQKPEVGCGIYWNTIKEIL